MSIADVVAIIELVWLVLIWWDGRVMKHHSAENVEIQREQLEHQKAYLELRKRWYASRTVKREKEAEKKAGVLPQPNSNPGVYN